MLYSIDGIKYNVEWNAGNLKNKIPIVFFHGFTGSVKDWYFLKKKLPSKFTAIFFDLLGHGNTDSPSNVNYYTAENQLEQINKFLLKLEIHNPILVGYSMGGRLALSFANKYKNSIRALVLESVSFGIEEKVEREDRVNSDKVLAEKISNCTIKEFINFWMNIPLFASQKILSEEILNRIYVNKVETNNVTGLQNSLLGFSSGRMKNYYPDLKNITIPILLIAGQLDKKYSEISNRVHKILPNSNLEIVTDCGHNVHLEKTEEFLKLLDRFLLNIRDEK